MLSDSQAITNQAIQNPEMWLWVDPFSEDEQGKDRLKRGSVLLAQDITRYITEHNVLVNRDDFLAGKSIGAKLKGASYTMTPDPRDAWMFRRIPDKGVVQVPLETVSDSRGSYYVIPKNSLVFIKLRQELRIPFYVIGRHNLKIRYVYKGLLLGTGPQVDPGYVGRLIIPLHNFTAEDVLVQIEASFVSIDFVRTGPFLLEGEQTPENLDELYREYEKSKCLIERYKVDRRTDLNDYLGESKPQSQMGIFHYDFEELKVSLQKRELEIGAKAEAASIALEKAEARGEERRQQFEDKITEKWDSARNFANIGVVGLIGIIVILLNLFRTDESKLTTHVLNVENATLRTNTDSYETRFQLLQLSNTFAITFASNSAFTMRRLESQFSDLTNRLAKAGLTNFVPNP